MNITRPALPLVVLCSALQACSGSINETINDPEEGEVVGPDGTPLPPGTPPPGSPPGTMGPTPPGTPAAPAVPGAAPLRRLSQREYRNTVRDLLGMPVAGGSFSPDQDRAGFAIGGPVSTSADASRLLDTAEQLATAAAGKIATLIPCANPAGADAESACAKEFITKFGRRAFRRPLDAGEIDDLFAVYKAHRESEIGFAFADAIRAVVTAMLASPHFLYRAELGPQKPIRDGNFVRFNPHEVASRLSYALWASMPDDTLFAEADAGRLGSVAEIEQQARRMLKDARFAETIADFHLQWLEVENLPNEPAKDPAHFKDHTPELVQAMLAETRSFVTELLATPQAPGTLDKLFTSTATTVDPALAKLYGVAMAGTGPRAVNLDPKQRAGILTHASFLSMHAEPGESHPVRRGVMMMRRVLCMDVPPPPNMEVGEPQAPKPGVTTRERFDEHSKQECASCHRLTDPIGFAFEHYDAIGAWRTTDQGKPVDASGAVEFPSGKIAFADAVELAKKLPSIKEVQSCMATQWFRYLTRRQEFAGDAASLKLAEEALGKSGGDMREMLVALVGSRAFTHRTPNAGEVLP